MTTQETLALACRILAINGHNDFIYGHVSALTDTPGQYWIKGSGIGLEEVTEDDLVLIDFAGNKIAANASGTMNFRFIAKCTEPIPKSAASSTRTRSTRRLSPLRNTVSCQSPI